MPATPKPAFPQPAATLAGEADVLANVLADLSDDHAKLVYADWLEDRDDPRGPLLREFVTAYRAGKKLPKVTSAPKPWRDLVGITLTEKLRGTDLAARTNPLLAVAHPTVALKSARAAEKTLALGASKLGGGPDMPPGAGWPTLEEEPLSFLGQFNLAELGPSPVARELPAAGLLLVFYLHDADEGDDEAPAGTWRLVHFPDTRTLARRLPPDGLFPPCRVEYSERLTLPALDSPWARALGREIDDESAYWNLLADTDAGDHLLGHPYPIHADVLGKKSVRHLLTIRIAGHGGWPIDGRDLYFTISAENLKKYRFDRAKLITDNG